MLCIFGLYNIYMLMLCTFLYKVNDILYLFTCKMENFDMLCGPIFAVHNLLLLLY